MRWLLPILFVITGFSFLNSGPQGLLRHRLIVLPDSKLFINGRTNVNKFQCAIARYCGSDTLILQEGGAQVRPVFVRGFVGLEASSFDCGMPVMTHDFSKTIKAGSHPIIGIDFKSFEKVPDYTCREEKFKGTLAITMAGVSRTFEMDCFLEAKPSGLIYLKGARNFLFSDFNLQPPQKMMGLIKVDESLNVQFNLVLKLDATRW